MATRALPRIAKSYTRRVAQPYLRTGRLVTPRRLPALVTPRKAPRWKLWR